MPEKPPPSVLDLAWRCALNVAYRAMLVFCFVFRPRHRGALVAIWCNDRLLVVRNSYRDGLSLPGGGIKGAERPVDAAARELHEELGLVVAPDALEFVADIPVFFEYQRDVCTFFELHLDEPPTLYPDGREVIWAGFMAEVDVDGPQLVLPVRAYLKHRRAVSH